MSEEEDFRFLPVEIELELLEEQLSHPYPTNADDCECEDRGALDVGD